MSLQKLKDHASRLPRAEQRKLIAFLIACQTAQDDEFKQELARKIDDNNPANWMTFEELEKRYSN